MWHLLGKSTAVQKSNRLLIEVQSWDLELAKLVQIELTVSIRQTFL